jgi:hypothetical protein
VICPFLTEDSALRLIGSFAVRNFDDQWLTYIKARAVVASMN